MSEFNASWDGAVAIEAVGSLRSILEDFTDVGSEALPVAAAVVRHGSSDVLVDIDSVDKDVLSNLKGNLPATFLVEQVNESLSILLGFGFSTCAVLKVTAEFSCNSCDLLNTRYVLVAFEIGDSGLDLADKSLDISQALEWEVNASDSSLKESSDEFFGVSLGESSVLGLSKSCKSHSVTDVKTHGVVVLAVVCADASFDVMEDVDSVGNDVLSDFESDAPPAAATVDVLKLLDEGFCVTFS